MTHQPLIPGLSSALATPLPRVLRPQRAVPQDTVRPTRAEINLANLRHNLRLLQRHAGASQVWSVLKADGYGHGSKAVARTLERAGTAGICVALLEEAIELRDAGIRSPILVMGGYFGRAWGEVLKHNLTPVLYDAGQIEELADEVRYSRSEAADIHVKFDTGMSRLGAPPAEARAIAEQLAAAPELNLRGLMTHFACADGGDTDSIRRQLSVFAEVRETLKQHGVEPEICHAANSAALFADDTAKLDMVRPGIAVFGVEPKRGMCSELKPVMTVLSRIIALRTIDPGQSVGYGWTWTAKRPTRVATLPMGYADGLSRALSNKGTVLVHGKRAPIIGVVSMDLTMVDVTDIPDVRLGDDCTVMGKQVGKHGTDCISATEIADQLGTIPWEVLTSVSRRVPRFYREP